MKSFSKIILVLVLCFLTENVFSNAKLDSLINAFKTTKNDTLKIRLAIKISRKIQRESDADSSDLRYLQEVYKGSKISNYPNLKSLLCKTLSDSYYRLNLFDLALRYGKEALNIVSSKNDETEMTEILIRISGIYNVQRKHEDAIKVIMQGITLAKKNKNNIQLARLYNGLAAQYQTTGDFEQSIKYFYDSMSKYELLNDTPQIVALIRNTALAYESVKDYNKSKQLLFKALKLSELCKDSSMLGYSYGSLGSLYQNTLQFDSALMFNTKQIAYLSKSKDKDNLAIAYGNLGIIYKAKKDYANAMASFIKALDVFKSLNSYRLISISYINIGDLYNLMKNEKKAIYYFDEVIKQSEQSNEKDILSAAHYGKYDAYLAMKNYKGALEEYTKFKSIEDSLGREKSLNKILRLESKYEMDKKQKENELLKAQDKVKQTLIDVSKKNERITKIFLYSSLAVLIIILVLAVLLFIGLKENKLKNKIITEQKHLVEEKNKDITDSINYAKRIQEALLPAKEVKYEIFPNAFVFFKPRDIVSGDFYWFTKKNGKRIITAVDCTGHGVPGALMSMIGNTFLNEIIEGKNITQPSLILSELRHMVIKSLKQTHEMTESKDGMDMSLLTFDDENNTVEYAGANNPMWLIRKGECIEYKPDKRPIGYYRGEGLPFTNHKIELQKGDTIYIFTDGYADQFGGENGKKLKYKPFREALLSIQHEPMLKQEEILIKKFDEWKGPLSQIDDVLIIGIRI